MRCIVCKHGETEPGVTTSSVDRGGCVVMICGVPADVCSTCGEEYLSGEVMKALEGEVEQAEQAGIEVAVRSFRAGLWPM